MAARFLKWPHQRTIWEIGFGTLSEVMEGLAESYETTKGAEALSPDDLAETFGG
jgi:hypothetical protein